MCHLQRTLSDEYLECRQRVSMKSISFYERLYWGINYATLELVSRLGIFMNMTPLALCNTLARGVNSRLLSLH